MWPWNQFAYASRFEQLCFCLTEETLIWKFERNLAEKYIRKYILMSNCIKTGNYSKDRVEELELVIRSELLTEVSIRGSSQQNCSVDYLS